MTLPPEWANITLSDLNGTNPPPDLDVKASDFGNAGQVGTGQLAAAVNRGGEYLANKADAPKVQEFFGENARKLEGFSEEQRAQYSPGAQKALSTEFATTDPTNAAWNIWDNGFSPITLRMAESAPNAVATIGPLGWAARAGYSALTLATVEGVVSAGLSGAYVAGDIAKYVEELSADELKDVGGYANYKEAGYTDDDIRSVLKEHLQTDTVSGAAAAAGVSGAITGPLLGKAFGSGQGLTARTSRAVAVEAPQEAFEEFAENTATNIGTQRDPLEGGLEAALSGAFVGGPTAGGIVALTGGKTRKQKNLERNYKDLYKTGTDEEVEFVKVGLRQAMGENAAAKFVADMEKEANGEVATAKAKAGVTPDIEEALKEHEPRPTTPPVDDPVVPTEPAPVEPTVERPVDDEVTEALKQAGDAELATEQETLNAEPEVEPTVDAPVDTAQPFTGKGLEHFDTALSTGSPDVSADPSVGAPLTTKNGRKSKAKKRPAIVRAKALAGLVDDVEESLLHAREAGYDTAPIEKVLDSMAKARGGRSRGETLSNRIQGRSGDGIYTSPYKPTAKPLRAGAAIDQFLEDLQTARNEVEAAGTQEVFTDITPTPEPRKSIKAQIVALKNGGKRAVLITPGTKINKSDIPSGYTQSPPLPNGKGTIIYKKGARGILNEANAWATDEASNSEFAKNILNYGVGSKPAGNTVTTSRDKAGTVIQDVVGAGGEVQQAAEQVAGEAGTVEVRTAEEAIAERAENVEEEKTAPNPKAVQAKEVSKARSKGTLSLKPKKEQAAPKKKAAAKSTSKARGELSTKNAASNLWSVAQGSTTPSVPNMRKATGVTDESIQPTRIRELLNTALTEIQDGSKKDLPANERKAVEKLKLFSQSVASNGSLKKQSAALPRPAELRVAKDPEGKGLGGTAATEGKLKLVGETAEEVAASIMSGIESKHTQQDVRGLVRDAINDVGAEQKLKDELTDAGTDPATILALVEAVQAGRQVLDTGDDTTFDRTEVVNTVAAESDSQLSSADVNTLVDGLVALDEKSRAAAMPQLLKTLQTTYGVKLETANSLAQIINDLVNDPLVKEQSAFQREEQFSLDKANPADGVTEEGAVSEDVALYQYDNIVSDMLTAMGISHDPKAKNFTTADNPEAKEVLERRVYAGRLLSELANASENNPDSLPYVLVLDLFANTLSKQDPLYTVLKKVQKLAFTNATFKGMRLAGNIRGQFQNNSKGGELTRRVVINTVHSGKATLSGQTESDIIALTLARTFVHESVHLATTALIHANPKVRAMVHNMMVDVGLQHPNRVNDYGLTDEFEFIAEAFTNPAFMQLLNNTRSRRTPRKSIWTELVDSIKQILGMDINQGSVMAEVISFTDLLFHDQVLTDKFQNTWIKNKGELNNSDTNAILRDTGIILDSRAHPHDTLLSIKLNQEADSFTARAASTMIDAMGNDGQAAYNDTINSLKGASASARKFMLGNMMMSQIETHHNSLFDNLMDKGVKLVMGGSYRKVNNPLDVLTRALRARQAAAKKFEVSHDNILVNLKKLETHKDQTIRESVQSMYDMEADATVAQVHPDLAWDSPRNKGFWDGKSRGKATAKIQHAKLREQYEALPKVTKDMYNDMYLFFATTHATMSGKWRANIIRKYDLDTATATAVMDDLNEKQIEALDLSALSKEAQVEVRAAVKSINSSSLSNGPYFPALRYGDYVAEARNTTSTRFERSKFKTKTSMLKAVAGKRHQLAAESYGSKFSYEKHANGDVTMTQNEYAFITAESKAEIETNREQWAAKGFKVEQARLKGKAEFKNIQAASELMAVAERKLRGNEQGKEAARIAFREAIVTFMPENAWQKRQLKREGVAGASRDMGRGLANYMKSAGWALANMDYINDISEASLAMGKASQIAAEQGNHSDKQLEDMTLVADELQRRMNNPNEPGVLTEYAGKLGFFNYLFSVSYSVVNSTQPMLITLPYLSGKFGVGKSAAAITSAYQKVGGKVAKEMWNSKFGFNAFRDEGVSANQVVTDIREMVRTGKNGTELADMLKELQDMDLLGATLALEIAEAGKGRGRHGVISKQFQKLMDMGRTMPHLVEILNRSTTAIATYELARESGMSKKDAVEEARLAVDKTQFDYSELNRPFNFVRNDLLRAMTMFKIHPVGIYGLLIGNVRTMYSNDSTKDEARAAGKTLAMLMATHTMFAGAAGGLLLEPIKVAMGMLSLVFDDDDEMKEWLANPDIAMRQVLYEATGSQLASEALTFGAPRLVGVDMHTRLGMQSLMLMGSNEGDTAFERGMNTVTDSLLGPILGMQGGFTRMSAAIASGQGMSKALEYVMPKGIRDIQRSIRYGSVGMTDFNGNLIQDSGNFSAKDLAVRAIGFSPSVEAETHLARGFKQRRTSRLTKKASGLVNKWKNADSAERAELWRTDIRDFNNSLAPEDRRTYFISRGKLQRGLRARVQRERNTHKGVHFNRRERRQRDDLDFINL